MSVTWLIEDDLAADDNGVPSWIETYASIAIGRLEKLLRLHAEFDEWLRGRL